MKDNLLYLKFTDYVLIKSKKHTHWHSQNNIWTNIWALRPSQIDIKN